MKTSIAFLFALALVALFGYSNAFEASSEVALAASEMEDFPLTVAADLESEASLIEADADAQALVESEEELESEADLDADVERRRRRRKGRKAKRAARKAKRAARKAKRAANKKAKKNQKAMKKAAKAQNKATKKNSVLRNLAKKFRKSSKKIKNALVKNTKRMQNMSKKLGVTVGEIRNAILHPGRATRKAKKLLNKAKNKAKKALKKAKKSAKKGLKKLKNAAKKALLAKKKSKKAGKKGGKKAGKRKFAPKKDERLLKGSNEGLRTKITKIVNEEPEAAAIVASKNAWLWEDRVTKRIDKFVPADNAELKARGEALTAEASDVCGSAEKACQPHEVTGIINVRTCQLSKEACFHAKVAAQKITRAQKQCNLVREKCGREGVIAEGECGVAKAKCKKYTSATDYSAAKAARIGKKVRDMQLLDEEANKLRVAVDNKAATVEPDRKFIQDNEAEFKRCKAVDAKVMKCLKSADNSGACAEAKLQATACKPSMDKFKKTKARYEQNAKELEKVKAERNVAEADANRGSV